MRQLPDEFAQRWMRLAVKAADEYAATDEGARRRWTTPGTSIRSARTVDAVAEVLTVLLLRDPAAPTPVPPGFWGEALADALASEWPLQQALTSNATTTAPPHLQPLPGCPVCVSAPTAPHPVPSRLTMRHTST
jgi:hypothetical protein